ncbi:MAG: carboxypeptidase-like regulatory domain-containing protein [Flammeovirgaceae bacterium]|nr:carboxypeptidase-like regulatory domain-containing protein [Flammeovirgaceae bacterium]
MNTLSLSDNQSAKALLYTRNLFLILILLATLPGIAQKITISGKAIDKETKEALIFATIGIKGKSVGTITNLQGEFDFHIPREFQNDLLVINMLGYKTFEAPVWTLLEINPLIIEVEKSTFFWMRC